MSFFERIIDFKSVHWWFDALDIIIVFFLFYQILKFVRGTAAIRIFIGAIAVYGIYKTTQMLHMELISEILGQFIGVGFIALIVVFQQEIRKFLLLIATPKIYNRFILTKWLFKFSKPKEENISHKMEPIILACGVMAKSMTGALIVISKDADMEIYKSLGESIDSELNQHLIEAIFHKESPLHDGALLISNNRIVAASCVLPISYRQDLDADLGLRHRAAIGVTENSSATAIVVSEQNGRISICNNGKLKNNLSIKKLRELINSLPE